MYPLLPPAFGLIHGHTLKDGNIAGSAYEEYGDRSTCMGDGHACPSAPELWRLGWATPLAELNTANLREGGIYSKFVLPATWRTKAGNMIKIKLDWLGSSYRKNVYLALRQRGGGDWELRPEFDNKLSIHTADRNVDNDFSAAGEQHSTIIYTLAAQQVQNMAPFRLSVRTGGFVDGGSKMEVYVCRYRSSVSECTMPSGGTTCPRVDGYSVQADVDHNQDDIQCQPGATDMASKCNADTSCKGWNSYGCTKRVVSPTSASQGMCLYTKIATSCPDHNGFTVTADVDHPGDDIDNVGVSNAASRCLADARCLGWNTHGWIKTSGAATSTYRGMCLYRKVITNCPQVTGYTVTGDVDHPFDDIANVGAGNAASRCTADARCLGWNSDGWIKTSGTATATARGMCLYTKITASLPILDGTGCGALQERYNLIPNYDWGSTPIAQQKQWGDSSCQPEKICRYWKPRYGILVGYSWGSMPETLRSSWTSLRCGSYFATDCPAVNGYTVQADVDHVGDDIECRYGATDMASKCDADTRCRGWNTYACVKTVVSPTGASRGMCLYTKTAPPPTRRLGASWACYYIDIKGTDIAAYSASSAQCRTLCQQNARCDFVAIAPNGNCYLKQGPLFTGPNGDNTYRTDGLYTCMQGTNYGRFQCVSGWDVNGDHSDNFGEFRVSSREECRDACMSSTSCLFFLYTTASTCVLKDSPNKGPYGRTEPSSYISSACFQVY